jgi:DNA repair exonuclease SbcCD ATPase subunit
MRFKRIKLQQACLHESLDVTLGDGLIGVFGPQGSGKSTLFNLAYAALTNDFSRIEGGKDGAVRQQSDRKEPSTVELWAEHGGADFHLLRRLAPTTAHGLTINEQPTIKKANEIQQTLEGVLGLDRQTLDRYVFVEQWGLRALFQQTPTERAKTLAHLCNTTHAEVCWDLVGKQLEVDLRLAGEVDDNTDELRASLGGYRAEVAKIEQDMPGLQAMLLTDEEVAAIKLRQKQQHRLNWLEGELPTLRRNEAALMTAAKTAVKAAKIAATAVEVTGPSLEEATEALQLAEQAKREHATKVAAKARQDADMAQIAQLENSLTTLSPTEPAIALSTEELVEEVQRLTAELAPYEALIHQSHKFAVGAAACPTCGQSLDDVQRRVEEAKAAAAPLKEDLATVNRQLGVRRAFDRELALWEAARTTTRKTLEQLQAKMVEEPLVGDPGPIASLLATVNACQQTVRVRKQEFDSAHVALARAADAKTKAITQHQTAKAELEKLEAEHATLLAAMQAPGDVHDDVRLATHQEARERLAGLTSALELQRQMIAKVEAEIKRIETLLARSQKAREWVEALQPVRNAFHRDSLPRLVHRDALALMEDDINAMLETFESPFRVTTSEDLSYVAHFRNGTVMPAKGLSGGQQVVLAIAFRWVLNSLFAGQIGMMILDEPTAGLDRRHVDLLETALRALGAKARSRGCQVVLVTHELSLEPVFDQVVRLGKSVA